MEASSMLLAQTACRRVSQLILMYVFSSRLDGRGGRCKREENFHWSSGSAQMRWKLLSLSSMMMGIDYKNCLVPIYSFLNLVLTVWRKVREVMGILKQYYESEQWDINMGSWGGHGTYLFYTCMIVYLLYMEYLNIVGVYTSHSVTSLGTRSVVRNRKNKI